MSESTSTHSVFSSDLKKERTGTLKVLIGSFIMLTVAMWALISLFYGSNYRVEYYFYRLKVAIYNLDSTPDGSILSNAVTSSLMKSMSSFPHLTFEVVNGTGMNFSDFENGVVNEQYWASIVINSNATTALNAALAGTGPYSPHSISIFVASARFFQVFDYILPFLNELLTLPVQMASQQVISTFLSNSNSSMLSAFTPSQLSAISQPFVVNTIDVRPILSKQWSGSAPLEAGLIYYIIFGFHVSIFLYNAREPFNQAIKSKSILMKGSHLVLLRLIPVGIAYVFLSLWYSLINVAFSVPLNGNGHSGLNSQAGFMVFWMLNLFTLSALGLAMESMITLLTVKFFPFFLITWIILNISSSFFPPILMEYFYRYGYAMPFYHSTTADKYLFWGARNRLGLNFGVLIAWTVISLFTMFIFEFGWRRRNIKGVLQERKEAENDTNRNIEKEKASNEAA